MNRTLRNLAVALAIVACTRIAVAGLPLTPSTTYVANSTPVIKAQDLNDLQKYLAGLYSALYTVKALTIDGTGGTGATALGGSGFNAVAPFNSPTVPWGQLNRAQVLLGTARCTVVAATIASCGGINIKSVSRISAGLYRIDFNTAGSNATRHVVTATIENSSPILAVVNSAPSIVGGAFRVDVHFYDLAGADVDTTIFHVIAVGG